MILKERIFYNQSIFEQIVTKLETKETNIYKHSLSFADIENNYTLIEIKHFKNKEAYNAYNVKMKLAEEKRKKNTVNESEE